MYTDPIADMIIRIKNAVRSRKSELILPYSKFKGNLAKLLQQEGFVSSVSEEAEGRFKALRITLKYGPNNEPVLADIKRVSKPGQRIYLPVDRLPRTNSGLGVTVVSTSKGLLTDRQARKERIGGEVVCQIW